MIQRDRAGECRETDIKNSEKHSAVNTVVYNETKQSHRNRIDSANRALRILDADRQNSIVESTKRYGKIVSPLHDVHVQSDPLRSPDLFCKWYQ